MISLSEIAEYGLAWPTWLAWLALGVMGLTVLAVLAMRQPKAEAAARWIFLKAPTMRGRLLIGFCVCALMPLLTLPPLVAVNSASYLQKEKVVTLDALAQSVANSIPGMVSKRVDIINSLANDISALGNYSDAALTDRLLRHHESHLEFVSMWIARPNGNVPVATAARNGKAERWGGPMAGVGIMDYFQTAVELGGNYVSDVRKGVAAGFHPMVFISAPVGPPGQAPWGYLQAQLNLSRVFGQFSQQDARAGNEVFVTDEKNRVMLSSPRLMFRQFENISGHPLFVAMNRNQGQNSFSFEGSILVTNESGLYLASTRALPSGWKVFAVSSMQSVNYVLYAPLIIGALWALLAFFMSSSIAKLFADSLAKPLQSLDESLDVFDAERTMSIFQDTLSEEAPSEVRDVYRKIRQSMRKSREAYDNMMRAVHEGEELKQRLQKVSPEDPDHADTISIEVEEATGEAADGGADDAPLELESGPEQTWLERSDSATGLPGVPMFEEFFKDAWNLGIADGKPLSLILLNVAMGNPTTLSNVAEALSSIGGRSLDFAGRTGETEFAVLLPDTDLKGALVVAGRLRSTALGSMLTLDGEDAPSLNLGISSIQPNADGNPMSFVDVGRRVLKASQEKGNGQIAFINEVGKISLATQEHLDQAGAA